MAERLKPVDGLRALCTLSLVALHTATLMTSFFPADGPHWARISQSPLFGAFFGGGVQTDIFLMLSGFLLATRARASPDIPSLADIAHDAVRRALPRKRRAMLRPSST